MSHNIQSLPPFTDLNYTTKHGVDLPLRIFPLQSETPSPAPWLLYVHGGAFSGGQHFSPLAWIIPGFQSRGYHIVSISYRLLPYARFDDIVEDCSDAFAWCLSHLAEIIGKDKIDLTNYVVGGGSAGGTMSVTLGGILQPRPKAVVDIYGLCDFTDPYFYSSTPLHPTENLPLSGKFPVAELEREVSSRDVSQALAFCPINTELSVELLQKGWQTSTVTLDERVQKQIDFKTFMRSRKILLNTLLREKDFATGDEWKEYIKSVNPIEKIDETYPPTWVLHGTADPTVPINQSHLVVEKLKKLGIPHGTTWYEGGVHVFDKIFTGPEAPGWDENIAPVLDFVEIQTKGKILN